MSKELKGFVIFLTLVGLILMLIGSIKMFTSVLVYEEIYFDYYHIEDGATSIPLGLMGLGFVFYLSGKAINDIFNKKR